MIIKRDKIFSRYSKKNIEEEKQRAAEREKYIKKLPKEDQEHAERMWQDTHKAGRAAEASSDMRHSLIGTVVGWQAGKAISKKLSEKVKQEAVPKAKTSHKIAGAIIGAELANHALARRAGKRAERVWDEGDKEILDFVKADKKTRKKMKKEYTPITPFGRQKSEK